MDRLAASRLSVAQLPRSSTGRIQRHAIESRWL
jgi:hypothetical protein